VAGEQLAMVDGLWETGRPLCQRDTWPRCFSFVFGENKISGNEDALR
jgi:hypothetical protein